MNSEKGSDTLMANLETMAAIGSRTGEEQSPGLFPDQVVGLFSVLTQLHSHQPWACSLITQHAVNNYIPFGETCGHCWLTKASVFPCFQISRTPARTPESTLWSFFEYEAVGKGFCSELTTEENHL